MRTEKQKFVRFLQSKGFDVNYGKHDDARSGFLFATLAITPHHRITPTKDHNIVGKIKVVNFSGSDTKKGDLGCVTICYHGVERQYRRREVDFAEVLKKVCCPNSAKEAIKVYKEWAKSSFATLKSWKIVL